ncbi:MAG: LytTR family transcriptional regulator [Chitinophagaceae bacterium]|jgi:two-component system LytT family response regulator|nr:LytTR family transcriptional regulator [Chitinophagaceae bacterium]
MTELPIYVYRDPVQASQIVRIEACSSYCRIYFTNRQPLLVAKVLQWFEDCLAPAGFVRTHRSHLVNAAYINRKVRPKNKTLWLVTGEPIPVSRRKFRYVLANFKQTVSNPIAA